MCCNHVVRIYFLFNVRVKIIMKSIRTGEIIFRHKKNIINKCHKHKKENKYFSAYFGLDPSGEPDGRRGSFSCYLKLAVS